MRRKSKWTRIHREDMNPYMFDGVRCEACKMCFGLPTPYCPNCGAKMQDNEDFEVGILIEPVRCKDCKYAEEEKTEHPYGVLCNHATVGGYGDVFDFMHYCSYGERKDE